MEFKSGDKVLARHVDATGAASYHPGTIDRKAENSWWVALDTFGLKIAFNEENLKHVDE